MFAPKFFPVKFFAGKFFPPPGSIPIGVSENLADMIKVFGGSAIIKMDRGKSISVYFEGVIDV